LIAAGVNFLADDFAVNHKDRQKLVLWAHLGDHLRMLGKGFYVIAQVEALPSRPVP